jgi:hypothetical protein
MRNLLRGITACLALATLPLAADAGVFVSVSIGPPVLPIYAPPPIPAPGYLWTPGYWGYADEGYYWVPGTWVMAPAVGLLWTPGYWGWHGGMYAWNAGYWGPHVGFYGGINYGFGYGGVGYRGGAWQGGTFVVNNTYINQAPTNRVAFNGGAGGVVATPTAEETRFAHERHVGMSQEQQQHEQAAARDTTMRAAYNHGNPPVAATQKPGIFYGKGVVAARTGTGQPPAAASHPTAQNLSGTHAPAAGQAPHGASPGGSAGGQHAAPSGTPHASAGAPHAPAGSPHSAAGGPHGSQSPSRPEGHGGEHQPHSAEPGRRG